MQQQKKMDAPHHLFPLVCLPLFMKQRNTCTWQAASAEHEVKRHCLAPAFFFLQEEDAPENKQSVLKTEKHVVSMPSGKSSPTLECVLA
jgi:hypothetical protein